MLKNPYPLSTKLTSFAALTSLVKKKLVNLSRSLNSSESQQHDETCETHVLVAGCSVAIAFVKAGKKVVILEAQLPGCGASTRNGGMIGGGYRLSLEGMTEKYGADNAFRY